MCGRFTLRTPMSVLIKQFALFDDFEIEPAFNIAPTQSVVAIRGEAEQGKRHADRLRWGLIPFWAKDASIGARMINARGETVHEKPSFRQPFAKRRCLVLSDGYYEWKKQADGKQPYYIQLADEAPFAYAGLWERWDKGEEPIESCTIVTTAANELTESIHDRMPVILNPSDYETWLDPSAEADSLRNLIQSFPREAMKMRPVSRYVNNVRHQGAQCLEDPDLN